MKLSQSITLQENIDKVVKNRTLGSILYPAIDRKVLHDLVDKDDQHLTPAGLMVFANWGYTIRLLEEALTPEDKKHYEKILLDKAKHVARK